MEHVTWEMKIALLIEITMFSGWTSLFGSLETESGLFVAGK